MWISQHAIGQGWGVYPSMQWDRGGVCIPACNGQGVCIPKSNGQGCDQGCV